MPTQSDVDSAFAQVGRNVLDTIGRALGSFAFGINPVSLGYTIGGAFGGSGGGASGSSKKHDGVTVVYVY